MAYLDIFDIEYNSNIKAIFIDLYISDEKKSFDEVADRHGLDIRTLYNYRKRYNELAIKLLDRNSLRRIIKLAIQLKTL